MLRMALLGGCCFSSFQLFNKHQPIHIIKLIPPLASTTPRSEDYHPSSYFSKKSKSQPELQEANHVSKLFTEAQQNILYLNHQRLMAMEELSNANKEIQTLLAKLHNLEVETSRDFGRDDSSILRELLLRIDSMVLTGMIDTRDVPDMRKLVMNSKANMHNAFTTILQKTDAEFLSELHLLLEQNKRSGFHVVHICTEMDPVVSVGSLAPYVTGLSRALQRRGNFVEVILPRYKNLDLTEVQGLREVPAEFYSYFNGQLHGNKVWTGVVYGIGVTLIQPMYYGSFFNRDMIYGYSDDFERFTYFSRASLDYLVKSGKHPDILHIHNWETAIVGPLFWDIFVNQGLSATRILLTCQGFGSQCLEPPEKLGLCGLDPSRLNRPDRLQDNTKMHLVNILKGGIIYSNKVVIMSLIHSKARIIQSLGHGLEPTLSFHKDKLVVAPYGFEHSIWDPSRDKMLPQNFSAADMKGKAVCKVSLQRQTGLSENASFILVGCILSEISDVDFKNLIGVLQIAPIKGVQFVFMGASKMARMNSILESVGEELKDENVRFINKYDEDLWHLIMGASDIILCQSYEDPVVQVALKAMRYGAVPVLMSCIDKRIRPIVEHEFGSSEFSNYMSSFWNMSLMEALDEITKRAEQWKQKMEEAMSKDMSWDADSYNLHISAYHSLTNL